MQNMEQIKRYIDSHAKGTVVFDADGTLWADDAGEAFFRWLIAARKLLNVNYECDLYVEYETKVERNRINGYKWIVALMAGLAEADIKTWANEFFAQYFVSRIYASQKELITFLKEKNFDIWIVSASNEWIIKAGAHFLNIDEAHVLGVRAAIKEGILTDTILDPFTYQYGKVAAIKQFILKQPAIAFGDSIGDLPMLAHATNLRVFITHQNNMDDPVVLKAKELGCLLQYFPLVPALQFEKPLKL